MSASTEKAQAAKKKAALDLAKKLHAAVTATNRFLQACENAGEPGRGEDDGRILLIGKMSEYAFYLEAVYDKE